MDVFSRMTGLSILPIPSTRRTRQFKNGRKNLLLRQLSLRFLINSWIDHDCTISTIFAYTTQLTKYRILYGTRKNSLNLPTRDSVLNFKFFPLGFQSNLVSPLYLFLLWGPNIYISSVKKSRDLWFNRERNIYVGKFVYKLEVPPKSCSFQRFVAIKPIKPDIISCADH